MHFESAIEWVPPRLQNVQAQGRLRSEFPGHIAAPVVVDDEPAWVSWR